MTDDTGTGVDLEWLYELLQDTQLEQFLSRIRDDLQVRFIYSEMKYNFMLLECFQ